VAGATPAIGLTRMSRRPVPPSSEHSAIASDARRGREMTPDPVLGRDPAGRHNLLQLIQLRWIAVTGQLLTIAFVRVVFGIDLPWAAMASIISGLVLVNLVSLYRLRKFTHLEVRNAELLAGLLIDVAVLTALLYFSGGAANPFIFLYPLQVTLAAVLLEGGAQWVVAGVTVLCFAGLMRWSVPLVLPEGGIARLFELHVTGMLVCFVLDAALLAIFVGRINRNFRQRDARLAAMRQRAAEEDHIVRMGLLASGAAHELSTPLSSLSVILGDWRRMPVFWQNPELLAEIADMQAEVTRCKTIVTGILMSAGETRGEAPVVTTIQGFLGKLVDDWRASHANTYLGFFLDADGEQPIVSDSALKQIIVNVLDNACEASPKWVSLVVVQDEDSLTLSVRDRGPGFAPAMLTQIGKPYQSSKGKPGGGLGLFLVVNVVRKLGGIVTAENQPDGGACVTLKLPLAALCIEEPADVSV